MICIPEGLGDGAVHLIFLFGHQRGSRSGTLTGEVGVGFQNLSRHRPGFQTAQAVVAKAGAVSREHPHGGERPVGDGIRGTLVVGVGFVNRAEAGRGVVPPGQAVVGIVGVLGADVGAALP